MNGTYAGEGTATYTPADNSVLGELRMSKENLYSYNIEIILTDEDQDLEEKVFDGDFEADNTQELAELVRHLWDHWFAAIDDKSDERYGKYDMIFFLVWNVTRISDDLTHHEDDTIPASADVHEELLKILMI